MKTLTRIAASIALATGSLAVSSMASAEVSYNVGFASEYYYRGIFQNTSSASAGIDYEAGGFYLGSWTADVGDGVEIDGYFGYGIETEAGFSASLGFTGYYYTGDFDDTYEEVNLNLGFGVFSLEYTVGEYDGFGSPSDYDFLGLTIENNGFYGTFGTFGDEFDGDYFELGYGFSLVELDFGISFIFNSDELNGGESDQTAIFTVGKTF